MLLCCLLSFVATAIVTDRMAERVMAQSEADALDLMQEAARAVTNQARDLFRTLDELPRLAELALSLGDRNDPAAKSAVIDLAAGRMRDHRLQVVRLRVRAPDGQTSLEVGGDPAGGPPDDAGLGLGQRWRSADGQLWVHDTLPMPGHQGWLIQVTLNSNALAAAVARALPLHLSPGAPAASSLIRMSDGTVIARSASALANPDALDLRSSDEILALVHAHERGSRRLMSVFTGLDTLVAFQTLPELGLFASVSARADDMLAYATLRASTIRATRWGVLLGALGLSAVVAVVLWRHRVRIAATQLLLEARATEAARADLDTMLGCSPAILYRGRLDPRGVYSREFVTPNAKPVTGWEPELLSDPERVWRLSAAEDRHLRGTNYARALKEGRAAVEYRFLRPDGGFSWLRNEALITERFADGSATVCGAITNISREREIAALAGMQNRMATLGQIATSLAHELTQPVTIIGMAAAIAQAVAEEELSSEELRAQINTILMQTDRAGDMIRHLRSHGHADGGPLAAVDMATAVRGALTLAGMPLREAGVEVSVNVAEGLPQVQARLVQVEQVLVNLMLNARDAMRTIDAGRRQLRVCGTTVGERVQISVSDTGAGVPPEVMPRLFEAFYTTKPPGQGTGLGLSLCRTMMQGFGGSISVGNSADGAVFVLDFKIALGNLNQSLQASLEARI